MEVTPRLIRRQHQWICDRTAITVGLINDVRADLAEQFETDVERVTEAEYTQAVDAVFADGDLAVNVGTLVALLRDLDVTDDYPGFIVDEHLGRELAAMIAGEQPLRLLGEATFHYADIKIQDDHAGRDDLDAALAAGFQTRLPGWEWTARESPFGVDQGDAD